MFTYATKKNRYGDEHIAVSAHGAEIATIKASSYYGNTEYIVSATTGGDDRGDYLGRASTIAGAKKKIRDWYSDHSAAVTTAASEQPRRRSPPPAVLLQQRLLPHALQTGWENALLRGLERCFFYPRTLRR